MSGQQSNPSARGRRLQMYELESNWGSSKCEQAYFDRMRLGQAEAL
jgi:hypothetical protein